MEVKEVLSLFGGLYNSKEFDLNLNDMMNAAEMSDDEFVEELEKLAENGDIQFENDRITLVTIEPKVDTRFNKEYGPTEVINWEPGTKIILDKDQF